MYNVILEIKLLLLYLFNFHIYLMNLCDMRLVRKNSVHDIKNSPLTNV